MIFPPAAYRSPVALFYVYLYPVYYLSRLNGLKMKHEEDFDANLAGEDGPVEESKTSWFKRIKKGITTSTAALKK